MHRDPPTLDLPPSPPVGLRQPTPVATMPADRSIRRRTIVRLMKYSAVSLVATTTSLVALGTFVGLFGFPATWSNVMATGLGTVPSFELNRRWVWGRSGRRSLFGQIVPFCLLSFTGLVCSTLAVGLVAGRTAGWGHWSRTVAVLSANVAAYGSLWVVQYRILGRILFRTLPTAPELTGAGAAAVDIDRGLAAASAMKGGATSDDSGVRGRPVDSSIR